MRTTFKMTMRQIAIAVCALLLAQSPMMLFAQAPQQVDDGQPIPLLSVNQLKGLVAPIALYPDPLLSQVLVAATYPLEVVEASQWLQRNPGLSGPALTQAAEQQNWDPSVQALVLFPDVIRQLNEDITWTTNIGNAFLAQQADVMNAVQSMRLQAQQAGSLTSTPQQQVITTTQAGQPVVVIEPVNPEVIYVPVYDPAWIWGPPIYYPYPRWHYPVRTAGIFFSFGRGISVGAFLGGGWSGWGSWGWQPEWGNRTVIVNNNFVHRYNFNSARTNFSGTTTWSHDAVHRQGVPYPAPALTDRYRAGVRQNLGQGEAPTQARVNPFNPRQPAAAPSPFERNAPPVQPSPARPSTPAETRVPFNPRQPAAAPSPFERNAPAPATPAARPSPTRPAAPVEPRFNPGPPTAPPIAPPVTARAPQNQPGERFGNREIAPNTPNRNRSAFGGIENGGTANVHTDHGYSSLGPARSSPPAAAPSAPRSQAPAQSRGSQGKQQDNARQNNSRR